jgi:hypothetical protein
MTRPAFLDERAGQRQDALLRLEQPSRWPEVATRLFLAALAIWLCVEIGRDIGRSDARAQLRDLDTHVANLQRGICP